MRLQYKVLLAWAVAFVVFGVVIGSLASNVAELLSSPNAQDLIKLLGGRQALTEAFLAAEISIMGLLAAAYGVSSANHLRSEEAAGHTEALLGTATTRVRWASSHFVFALAGVALLLLLAGASIGAGAAFAVNDAALVGRSTVAALAQIPAAWVVTSVALVVFGWAPRLAGAVWGLLLALVALGEFGVLWNAPEWLMDLSPFRHSPLLPVGSGDVPALAVLTWPRRPSRRWAIPAGAGAISQPKPCLPGERRSRVGGEARRPGHESVDEKPLSRRQCHRHAGRSSFCRCSMI